MTNDKRQNPLHLALQGVRKQISGWLEPEDDPEVNLERAIAQMSQDLIQLRQTVAKAIASSKRTERQERHNQALAADWYGRAQQALDEGDEAAAKVALARRQSYLEAANTLSQQLQAQRRLNQQLRQNLLNLEQKLAQSQAQQAMLVARWHSARAACHWNGDTSDPNTARAIAQFEDRIAELEAQAELAAELSGQNLERRFSALEAAQDIEREWLMLKAQHSKKH